MVFEQVILIGTGQIACDCLVQLSALDRPCIAVELDALPVSMLRETAQRLGLTYINACGREHVAALLTGTTKDTLVVSANNNYIFPPRLVRRSNLKIINFHNAILPRHRGRNAPTWTIFEMDEEAGSTWHVIDEGIDTGAMFAQQSFPTTASMTALELTRRCMKLGAESFAAHLAPILEWEIKTHPYHPSTSDSFHRAADVPNEGVLDLDWDCRRVSAFLRSIDYGCIPIFPKPKVILGGREYVISSYAITFSDEKEPRETSMSGNTVNIHGAGCEITIALEGG